MKIIVDRSKCTTIGICESLAPEYYEVNEDGDLVVLREDVPDGDLELLMKTVTECPTGALSLSSE